MGKPKEDVSPSIFFDNFLSLLLTGPGQIIRFDDEHVLEKKNNSFSNAQQLLTINLKS